MYRDLTSSSYEAFFRILYIGNDLAIRKDLTQGFAVYGFEMISADHGIDAMIQFHGEKETLGSILMDHDGPNINGAGFAKFVRSFGFNGRIVPTSRRLSVSDLRTYQNYGISGIFSTPLDLDMVATLLFQPE